MTATGVLALPWAIMVSFVAFLAGGGTLVALHDRLTYKAAVDEDDPISYFTIALAAAFASGPVYTAFEAWRQVFM